MLIGTHRVPPRLGRGKRVSPHTRPGLGERSRKELPMKAKILLMGAVALAFAPASASAAPPTTSNGAAHSGDRVAAGQPGQDCNTLVADPSGNFSFPGHSTTSPGSAFNE